MREYGHRANEKSPAEIKADIADERCMICESLFCNHSQQQFEECMDEIVKRARVNYE